MKRRGKAKPIKRTGTFAAALARSACSAHGSVLRPAARQQQQQQQRYQHGQLVLGRALLGFEHQRFHVSARLEQTGQPAGAGVGLMRMRLAQGVTATQTGLHVVRVPGV